jgi:hypothetical protein
VSSKKCQSSSLLRTDYRFRVVPGFQSLAMKAGDVATALDRFVLTHPRATGVGIEGLEVGTVIAGIAAATGLARLGAFALGLGETTSSWSPSVDSSASRP